MAFELGKLNKWVPLVAVYSFYNVFATAYPSDPIAGMKAMLTALMADPIGRLKAKTQNIILLAAVIIGVPILLKSFKLPTSVKMIANVIVYYIIGDQVASIIVGVPGRFGAAQGNAAWGGKSQMRTAPTGVIRNVYGG